MLKTSRVNERETRKRVESTEEKKHIWPTDHEYGEKELGASEEEGAGIVGGVVLGKRLVVFVVLLFRCFEEEEEELN